MRSIQIELMRIPHLEAYSFKQGRWAKLDMKPSLGIVFSIHLRPSCLHFPVEGMSVDKLSDLTDRTGLSVSEGVP